MFPYLEMIVQKSIKMKNSSEISVFDTNIFLTEIDFNLIRGVIYTTPKILDEVKVERYAEKNRNIVSRIHAALESQHLIIKIPSEKYLEEVEKKSKITGDFKALSVADKELIALTLELKDTLNQDIILYTNDYSIENLCMELKIKFSPLGKEGIKSKIMWEVYCPFCQEVHDFNDFNTPCERCGQKLKRRKKKL